MSTNTRPTFRAALPALAVAAAVSGSFLLAAPAHAADGAGAPTATYKADGTGLTGVLPDSAGKRWPAGTTILTAEGQSVEAYCIEFTNFAIEKTGTYTTKTWAASGVKNLAKAADVASRHNSIGTPMSDKQWEKAATQVAVWHFTDNVGWDKTGSAKFTARVKQLIDGAKASSEPAASFKLSGSSTVAGEGQDAKNTIVAKLTTVAGAPLANQSLTFVVDGKETLARTGADGTATTTVPAEGARTAKVSFTGTLPAGTVFAPESGKQAMLTEAPVTVSRTASLMLAAAPKPPAPVTPTPTPTTAKPTPTATKTPLGKPKPIATPVSKPKPTPVAQPQPKPKKLPMTGGEATGWMLGGALLVSGAGFGGWRMLSRRR